MIGFDIGGPEAIIVLVIVLVLFGGSQIPKLARNLGRAQKEFKDGIDEGQRSASSVTDTTATNAPTPNKPAPNPSPDGSGQPSN
jgi:sec-independent protein translocase protein TatA